MLICRYVNNEYSEKNIVVLSIELKYFDTWQPYDVCGECWPRKRWVRAYLSICTARFICLIHALGFVTAATSLYKSGIFNEIFKGHPVTLARYTPWSLKPHEVRQAVH